MTTLAERRSVKPGILRLDLTDKTRRTSAISVEFKDTPDCMNTKCIDLEIDQENPIQSCDRLSTAKNDEEKVRLNAESPAVEKVRFTSNERQLNSQGERSPRNENDNDEEDDEYSASVSAIMVRQANRQSWNKRSSRRRGSSPFSPEQESAISNLRRRSSVFTTSSGDTGVDTEEKEKQEQIYQQIKLHKEVLSQVKYQPWPIWKKLKLVRTAKAYIKQHEGALQERLALNRTTKDILAHFNIQIVKQWNHIKRELLNMSNLLIPWELRIKEIESHFGSVVASYFTFLRWLFSVNLVIAIVLVTFIAVPEVLMTGHEKSGERKEMLPDEKRKATNLVTLWNFEGVLKYSPVFYGYYNYDDEKKDSVFRYRLPLAYFSAGLAVYIYSFVAILRKMAENSRQSKLSEKDEECVFTWKIFTGWDYMIGNAETAHNRIASIVLGFREALLEEAEKKRNDGRNWKLTSLRILTHLSVMGLLGTSMYAVVLVVRRSTETTPDDSWWRQNEVTLVVSIIGFLYPMIFDLIRLIERDHPRKALRLQLARIMVLNLLNLYSFIFATFSKIDTMTEQLSLLKPNDTLATTTLFISTNQPSFLNINITSTTMESITSSLNQSIPFLNYTNLNCTKVFVECPTVTTLAAAALIFNATTSNNYDNVTETASFSNNSTEYNFNNFSTEIYTNISEDQWNHTENPWISTDYVWNSTDNYTNYYDINVSISTFPSEYNNSEYDSNNTVFTTEFYTPSMINFNSSQETSTEQTTQAFTESCYILKCSEINSTEEYDNSSFTTIENLSADLNITLSPTTDTTTTAEPDAPIIDLSLQTTKLDLETRKKLRNLCWETMFGQELVKLTIMDLIITITSILIMDFIRAVFVRVMNNCWCWDLEKRFPQYGDFKIAENILHLVNNQGMVWMGMFFSPGLPLINLIKLIIIMYMRSWAVLTCNVPHEVIFKASRSNNFYLALLLTMLFLCVLPVGYAIVWVQPSWHCGPFSNYKRISHLFTRWLKKIIPKSLHRVLDYIASPGIVIPLLMLLVLIIYYLISLTNALREANDDLKIQLRRERTEERRKMLQMVDKKRRGIDAVDTPFNKWRKLLSAVPEVKSPVDVTKDNSLEICNEKKELITSFLKRAARKSSNTSEEGYSPFEPDTPKEINPIVQERTNKRTIKNDMQGIIRSALKNKRKDSYNESIELKDNEDSMRRMKSREDSVTSNRSGDNIPEIKIIETDTNGNQATTNDNLKSETETQKSIEEQNIKPYNSNDGRKQCKSLKHRNNEEIDSDETSLMHIGDSYESIPLSIMQMQDLSQSTNHSRNTESADKTNEVKNKKIAKAIADELNQLQKNGS